MLLPLLFVLVKMLLLLLLLAKIESVIIDAGVKLMQMSRQLRIIRRIIDSSSNIIMLIIISLRMAHDQLLVVWNRLIQQAVRVKIVRFEMPSTDAAMRMRRGNKRG